jgi:hypothetical protein
MQVTKIDAEKTRQKGRKGDRLFDFNFLLTSFILFFEFMN